MSSITEIEAAIEKLDESDLAELASWWEQHLARVGGGISDAIAKTSGCLEAAGGEDFANAVAEAGQDVTDSHGW